MPWLYLFTFGGLMSNIGVMNAPKKKSKATPEVTPEPEDSKPKRERKMVEIQAEFLSLIEIARKRLALKTDTAVVNQAVREFLERDGLWPPAKESP